MEHFLRWFRCNLKSRTVVVGLVTTGLGITAMFFPDLGITAPPEALITGGLGMLYLREGIANVSTNLGQVEPTKKNVVEAATDALADEAE